MDRIKDITGQRFSRLLALKLDGTKATNRGAWWVFRCDCGTLKSLRSHDVVGGRIKSCGCLNREGSHRTHNGSHTPEYSTWIGIKKRCTNPRAVHYKDYGGRGIRVCGRWQDFAAFMQDMGPRPGPHYSIERIDVNGDYCPENCRWIPLKEQARNTKRTMQMTWAGRTQTVTAWAREIGIDQAALWRRINRYGWSIEEALTTPSLGSGCRRAKAAKTSP